MDKQFVEQKLKEITEKIVKEYQPEKIILFGSWAWGKPDSDSDIDLLVVKESTKARHERQSELRTILRLSGVPFDLLVYTHQELEERINVDRNLFLEDIIRNGRVLYSKSGFKIQLKRQPAELVL